jgi:uncharacterized pyridoxamine 5'-phosphate oxidase family protein
MSGVDEVAAFLSATPDFYFATVDADNRPRVRPFGLALAVNGHLWFGTNTQKKVFAEIQKNPYIEVCSFNGKNGAWVRVSGKIVPANELAVKQKIFEVSPQIGSIYQNPENPILFVFYVEGKADFYSLKNPNGAPEKTIDLN